MNLNLKKLDNGVYLYSYNGTIFQIYKIDYRWVGITDLAFGDFDYAFWARSKNMVIVKIHHFYKSGKIMPRKVTR